MRVWLLMVLLVSPWVVADIYKTVDKDGKTIYTDSPKTQNAERVQLRDINTVPGAEPLPESSPVSSFESQPADVKYLIEIVSPRADVTIPVGQRDLAIAVSLNPELQAGHLLVYFLDGELLEETTMTNIIVKDVPRGTHTLAVEAIDTSGQSLGVSAPVIVNVIRPVIKKNAPPKPTPK